MIAGVVGALVLGVVSAASASDSPMRTDVAAPDETRTVTLITGDRVILQPDGSRSVRPASGRANISFSTTTHDDHLYVVPSDAAGLVGSGRVDPRLFDVTTLLEYGYDDARRGRLPLIVTHLEGQELPEAVVSARGSSVAAELSSVDGVALLADKPSATAVWDRLTAGAGVRTTAAGVSKIWLDGVRKSALDKSVPQIGAPAAWDAGYTGDGVKVAVLDTGVDQTHPDLADREVVEKNFSGAPDSVDKFGHGTHVASIIAGTGAKSGGKYRGVADGTSILDGKVLDDTGSGQESWIIAGMQWAAEQGATIANLSLGGPDTAEIDPMEEAVNTLSAEHGTLFVIASGNAGGSGTVSSPGSADAALTVGAVDRTDNLAPFSSSGPRIGDNAIKPDVTAPGVGIVAALHSAGTIGDPVEPGYVALSGTSMATPHVAGSAALLAQQHPQWTGAQLKAALIGSAKPNPALSTFNQGAGRIDVARAIAQTVVCEPATASLGVVPFPHDDDEPATKPATYRNLGDADVTLILATEAVGPDGKPAPDGVFTVSANEITVPAGGTAEVDVTGDATAATADGDYTGAVVATAGETAVRTPMAITREGEIYSLTLNFLDRNGKPTTDFHAVVQGLDNWTHEIVHGQGDSVELRLPPGQYSLYDTTYDANNNSYFLPYPYIELNKNTTINVDAREAKPVSITPPVEAELVNSEAGYRVMGSVTGIDGSLVPASLDTLFTAQLGPPAPPGFMVSFVNSHWTAKADGSYYGLGWTQKDTMPTGLTKNVSADELATVKTKVAPAGPDGTAVRSATMYPADEFLQTWAMEREVPTPGTVTEHFTTDGVRWVTNLEWGEGDHQLTSAPHVYEAGKEYEEKANYGMFGPSLPVAATPWVGRYNGTDGDMLFVSAPLFGDSTGNAGVSNAESANTKLYRGDELLGETDQPGDGNFDIPLEEGDYRLATWAKRPSRFDVTTRISAEWTFHSAHEDGPRPRPWTAPVDLSVVRFSPELDETNTAPAGQPFEIPVALQGMDGGIEQPAELAVEVSYDEGETWQPAEVAGETVRLDHPADATSVSLRASATDSDGSTVKQTIIRAYKLA